MKRILAILLAVMMVVALAACGSTPAKEEPAAPAEEATAPAEETTPDAEQPETAEPAEDVEPEAVVFEGDGYDATVDYAALAGTTITVAATPVPHVGILQVAAEYLAAADITLDIKEFDDYVQPNNVVEEGELFANFFQHIPYLDSFNDEYGTHLVSIAGIHVEPMAVYPGTGTTLEEIADGAKIAVPNDTTNEARALALLEEAGLIKLDPDAGLTATKLDIVENPHNIDVVEVEAANIPNVLADVDFGVINGNYAVGAGLNPTSDSVAVEGSASAYVNILVVKEGNENTDAAKALVAAVMSDKVRDYINDTYTDGSVIAVY